MITTASSPLPPLEGRVLVLAPHEALVPLLHALGLRAEAAAEPGAALHTLLNADLALDPFQLVIGTTPQLAASLAGAQLLAAPQLLTAGAALHDPLRLREAMAAAIAPRAPPEPLVIEGIDTVAGLENLGGDRTFYLKLLERFWRLHRASLVLLMQAAQARRWDEVMRLAHALRGSAAGIGARAVREAADQLELAIHDNGEPAPGQAMALAGELGAVLAALTEFHESGHDAGHAASPDLAHARAVRAKLEVLLSEFSGEAIDYFDEEGASLEAILPKAALEQLAGHLERYEFDAARAILGS